MPARLPDVPVAMAAEMVDAVTDWQDTQEGAAWQRNEAAEFLLGAVLTYGLSAVARAIGWDRRRLWSFIGKGDRT